MSRRAAKAKVSSKDDASLFEDLPTITKPKLHVPRMSSDPTQCAHTIFIYLTDAKATQVCTGCGSQRRLYRETTGVTAGKWALPET